jgi:hypothetical protein
VSRERQTTDIKRFEIMPTIAKRTVPIEHMMILSTKSFTDVRAALERTVPQLDPTVLKLLANEDVERVNSIKESGPELSIFLVRDHGALLQIAGRPRKALQYDIGNPITASLIGINLRRRFIHRSAWCSTRTTTDVASSNTTNHLPHSASSTMNKFPLSHAG